MLDRERISDIALELRECQKRISSLNLTLKAEREKEKELYKELDELMDKAVEGRK